MSIHAPLTRRSCLTLCVSAAAGQWLAPQKGQGADGADAAAVAAEEKFRKLEQESGGRLGVAGTAGEAGQSLYWRGDERFAFCSTFKVVLAGAILKQAERNQSLLGQTVVLSKDQIVTWSPVTEKLVGKQTPVDELCRAALQYSDNSAANALIRVLGGLDVVTEFARSLGDSKFRLDRWETELNTAVPGDERDTTTPKAMASTLRKLVLGDALDAPRRRLLKDWMLGNTTGAARIRAGVPAGWPVADKTGTGDYGTSNDVGVVFRPAPQSPLVVAIYYTHTQPDAPMNNTIIAEATRVVVDALSKVAKSGSA